MWIDKLKRKLQGSRKRAYLFMGATLGIPIRGSGRIWEEGLSGWTSLETVRDGCNGVPEEGSRSPWELC
jgi:hypothetical protein